MISGVSQRLSLLVVLLIAVSPVWAVLPAFDSQGKQLPSLSPLIKEVGPSVVNLSLIHISEPTRPY